MVPGRWRYCRLPVIRVAAVYLLALRWRYCRLPVSRYCCLSAFIVMNGYSEWPFTNWFDIMTRRNGNKMD
eukprot:scaffold432_cov69-Cyclotella_meneghiniana.AAC.28